MNFLKKSIALALVLLLALSMTACSGVGGESSSETSSGTVSSFDYSAGLTDDGFWEGVTALDCVTLCDYDPITIPKGTHEVSQTDLDAGIQGYLSSYTTTEQITDREVKDGDTVNIDYVGSVDGVEFENGSTGGSGTDVTIGVTTYIDDFLDQLVGHKPGETFNVEVTFPDPYTNNTNLSGKDAVFVTTINYISETVYPDLTDSFVSEKLSGTYGWTTVAEMTEGVRKSLQDTAISNYISDYIMENSTVTTLPDSILEYQENSMIAYYENYASYYSVTLEEFLSTYVGFESVDALKKNYLEQNTESAKNALIIQAIAEKAGLSVNEDDLKAYFKKNFSSEDYSSYETQYGLPYLKLSVLSGKVLDHLVSLAVLGE